MELQADKFAGGVLFLLGASLDESKAGIDLLQSKGESDTHPPARARAEAIANGWKNSQEHHESIPHVEPTVPPIEESKPIETAERPESKPYKSNDEPYNPPDDYEEVDFTEVSDQLLANYSVGFWQNAYYNTYGAYVVNRSALYANGAYQLDTYMNGAFSSQSIGTWGVEKGQLILWDSTTGIYAKYRLDFYDTNTVNLTFTETNGVYVIPVGTIFTYGRTY